TSVADRSPSHWKGPRSVAWRLDAPLAGRTNRLSAIGVTLVNRQSSSRVVGRPCSRNCCRALWGRPASHAASVWRLELTRSASEMNRSVEAIYLVAGSGLHQGEPLSSGFRRESL